MGFFNFIRREKKEKEEIQEILELQEKINKLNEDTMFLQNNFGDYDIGSTDGYEFIYRYLKDLKKTLIICSLIKEGDVPLDEIKEVYGLDDEYIDNVIDEEFPIIKAEAYKYLRDVAPNVRYMFFPNVNTHKVEIYKEFTDRIEYITELRRNGKKLNNEFGNNAFSDLLKENVILLELLNYFNVEESLNVASNLSILKPLDDELVQSIYTFDDDEFKELLGSKRMKYLEDDLKKKIDKFTNITQQDVGLYTGIYLDYDELVETYTDTVERINQTKEYVFYNNKVKKRKM